MLTFLPELKQLLFFETLCPAGTTVFSKIMIHYYASYFIIYTRSHKTVILLKKEMAFMLDVIIDILNINYVLRNMPNIVLC